MVMAPVPLQPRLGPNWQGQGAKENTVYGIFVYVVFWFPSGLGPPESTMGHWRAEPDAFGARGSLRQDVLKPTLGPDKPAPVEKSTGGKIHSTGGRIKFMVAFRLGRLRKSARGRLFYRRDLREIPAVESGPCPRSFWGGAQLGPRSQAPKSLNRGTGPVVAKGMHPATQQKKNHIK